MSNLQRTALERAVVVDFAIDRKEGSVLRILEGLRTTRDVDDGQSLVGKDSMVCLNDARPIWSAMMLSDDARRTASR